MNTETLETALLTFMYFLHVQDAQDDADEVNLFHQKWSDIYYSLELLSEGEYHE